MHGSTIGALYLGMQLVIIDGKRKNTRSFCRLISMLDMSKFFGVKLYSNETVVFVLNEIKKG